MSQNARPAPFEPLSQEQTLHYLQGLLDRFGIPIEAVTDHYVLHQPNAKQLLLVNKDTQPPLRPEPTSVGMPFMSVNMRHPKLSTPATMLLGELATKHVVSLTQDQCALYLSRQEVLPEPEQLQLCSHPGYVILKFQGYCLGQGFWATASEEAPVPRIMSLYPKASANRADRHVF